MKADNALRFRVNNIAQNHFNLLLLLAFLSIAAIGMVNHEMWRDELEAWLIARDSVSIPELFENLEYTGHPALWYLCLYFLAKITLNPFIIQIFHLAIATGVVYVFLYYSTFNKLQKILFCFGYFPLYEYGIISRNYSLGVLFVFIFCTLFCQKNHNYIIIATVLALLSHTNVYGLIISINLAAMVVYEAKRKSDRRRILTFKRSNIAINLTASIVIYLFGSLSAIAQIIPPADAEIKGYVYSLVESNNSEILKVLRKTGSVVTGIWRSYVPIPDLSVKKFWGSNIISDRSQLSDIATIDLGSIIAALLSLSLFLIFIVIFLRSGKVLSLYIFGTLSITTFGFLVKLPALRHDGHLFILLIACFWIYIYETKHSYHSFNKYRLFNWIHSYRNTLLTIILSLQLYAGALMYSADLFLPFSNSKIAAQFIKENNLEELTIIGSEDKIIAPLSAWLNKKIYYPEIQDFGTFTVWTSKSKLFNSDITQRDILKQVEQLNKDTSNSLLLILDRELNQISTSLNIQPLAAYKNSIVAEEKYFIYSID